MILGESGTSGDAGQIDPKSVRKDVELMSRWIRFGLGVGASAAVASVLVGSAAAHAAVAPTIVSFTPTHALAGTTVAIYGHDLAGAQVQFNGMPAMRVTVNAGGTHLKAVDPETTDGPSRITVITAGGTVQSATFFTVEPPTGVPALTGTAKNLKPVIVSVTPMRAKVGTKVTIKGTNLGGAMWVKFGGVKALYTVPKANTIIATVPKQARSGKISIRTDVGLATTLLHLTVAAAVLGG